MVNIWTHQSDISSQVLPWLASTNELLSTSAAPVAPAVLQQYRWADSAPSGRYLAFDTATHACSMALYLDGQCFLIHQICPQQHAELFLERASKLLDHCGCPMSQLDGLMVGVGPGSFIGVRIAVAAAQAISLAHAVPIVPLSTLNILAQGSARILDATHCLSVWDARLGEVYWGMYAQNSTGQMAALNQDALLDPSVVWQDADVQEALAVASAWHAVGSGWAAYPEQLESGTRRLTITLDIVPDFYPNAMDALTLGLPALAAGLTKMPDDLEPSYLREEVAHRSVSS